MWQPFVFTQSSEIELVNHFIILVCNCEMLKYLEENKAYVLPQVVFVHLEIGNINGM